MDNSVAQVDALLHALNELWVGGDAPEVAAFLHDDVVFIGPDGARIEGKAACVDSYVQFVTHSMVTSFGQTGAVVDVVGDTAVATYSWDIEYVWMGLTSMDSGRDLFVLQRQPDVGWLVTWRMALPSQQVS